MEMELPFCDFGVTELTDGDFVVLLYKNVPALLSLCFFVNLNYAFFHFLGSYLHYCWESFFFVIRFVDLVS